MGGTAMELEKIQSFILISYNKAGPVLKILVENPTVLISFPQLSFIITSLFIVTDQIWSKTSLSALKTTLQTRILWHHVFWFLAT